MLRKLGAIVAGALVALVISFAASSVVESIHGNFGMSQVVAVSPTTLVAEAAAFFVAAFAGCYLANRLSGWGVAVWVVAVLSIGFDLMNATSVVQPGWFIAVNIALPLVAAFAVRSPMLSRARA